MSCAQTAIFPPAFGQAGFLPRLVRIREKDLARDGEGVRVAKTGEEWSEEVALNAHVAVEQDDDVVLRGSNALVRAASEAEVAVELDEADVWEMAAYKSGAAVG